MDSIPTSDLGVEDFRSAIGATPISWPVDSTVQLCNVPWDSEYANVVRFDDAAARDAYFDGLASTSVKLTKLTYCFPNAPVHINLDYASVYTYNYIVVTNPKLPTDKADPVKFYYFINNVVYTAPNTTSLELQLDVWTTYQFNVTLGRGFCERGHVAWHAYANSEGDKSSLKRRYLSQPEGLDTGSSYIMNNAELESMGGGLASGSTQWTVIICSAVELENGDSSLDSFFGTSKSPKLNMAKGMVVDGIPTGCVVYGMEAGNFKSFVKALSPYPWISTNILSITAVPEGVVTHDGSVTIAGVSAYKIKAQRTFETGRVSVGTVYGDIDDFASENVSDDWAKHPKSRVFPYTQFSADNYCSTPVTLKPELFDGDEFKFQTVCSVVPPFLRILVFPQGYGNGGAGDFAYTKYKIGDSSSSAFEFPAGLTFGNALQWDDFPQFAILNDSYISYMASNARSIQHERDSAKWQRDKSIAGAQLAYDNSMRGIDAATRSQAEQRQFELTRAERSSSGAYLSALSDSAKNVSDAFGLSNATDKYIKMAQNSIAYTTGRAQSNLGQTQFEINKAAQTENAGANLKTQRWAAKGDYQNAIAGINATCQDASILPPTQSAQLSGGMYATLGQLGATNWQLSSYTVTPAYQRSIADYWSRFGYAVNDYIVPTDLQIMSSFTYWKFQDLVIGGTKLPEKYRMVIKGIFEKGVTVFGDASDIEGGYDVISDNVPKTSAALY